MKADDGGRDVFGATIYARQEGTLTKGQLADALRCQVPYLIDKDPDDYWATREIVFDDGKLTFSVAVGECRDGTLWYAVMAVGRSHIAPPEYLTVSRAVGIEVVMAALDAGDFQ